MTTLRKASVEDRDTYAESKPVYPLGYLTSLPVRELKDDGFYWRNYGDLTGETKPVFVEDLRGAWSRPDPVWECVAPPGYRFDGELHTMLCYDLKDVRERLSGSVLTRCHEQDCCAPEPQHEVLGKFETE